MTALWQALGGGLLALATFVFGLHSGSEPLEALLPVVGFALVFGAALIVRLRGARPALHRLLYALAASYLLQTFVQSDQPLLFTAGRLARPLIEGLLIWVMLAFPSGVLGARRARLVVATAMLALPLLWLLGMLLAPQIPMGGRFVTCGVDCPRNLLLLADRPELAGWCYLAFRVLGVATAGSAAALLLQRLLAATPLMRQTLAPVLFASICRMLSVAYFLVFGGGTIALTVTFWLVPAAIVIGLLRGRLYMASALQKLVAGLRGRPSGSQLTAMIAAALSDPSLSIAYRSRDRWVDADGAPVELPGSRAGSRRVTQVDDAQGRPVAALGHDIGIDDEPLLIDAVASAMLVALEGHRAELEIVSSRSQAAAEERRRIERDLHDGAQQRLIALRIKLSVMRRVLNKDPRRGAALLAELDADVDAALQELRSLAHGEVPAVLQAGGLAVALPALAAEAGIEVDLQLELAGALSAPIERCLYFCASEALQNAAKHAPPGSNARLRLWRADGQIGLRVENRCTATAGADARGGQGLTNLRERVALVGGSLRCGVEAGSRYVVEILVPA